MIVNNTRSGEPEIRFKQISMAASGGYTYLYGLTEDGRIYTQNGEGWEALPMTLKQEKNS